MCIGLQDPATVFRMVQKCGPQIFACVNDPDCKAALDCLQACDPTDQVPVFQFGPGFALSECTSAVLCCSSSAIMRCTAGSLQRHACQSTMHLVCVLRVARLLAGLLVPVHRVVREPTAGGLQPVYP